MMTLKHLKTLQHVSIIIQIIFRELICTLLKLLILKFVKNVKKPMCSCGSITYTGCPRRNVKYFGRVLLMLNYTDITQNTYIQS